jgi:hypothetical protein
MYGGGVSEPLFDHTFWQAHPGLVWSNAQATDSQRIRAALVKPLFQRLLDIAVHFGLDRLRAEWQALLDDADDEVERAKPAVERILLNIEKGHVRAAAAN